MKKILLGFIVFILISFSVVFATENNVGTEDNIPVTTSIADEEKEIIENDYFKLDEEYSIENKLIYGNLFLIGQNVKIKDVQIMGSIFVLSEDIDLDNVFSSGSMYVLSGNVKVENSTLENIYSFSQNQNIGEGTTLEKDFYSFAKSIDFNGVSNENVSIYAENVTIGSKSSITGNLEITSSTEPKISNLDKIGNYKFNLEKEEVVEKKVSIKTVLSSIITYVFIASVISIIIAKLCPSFVDKVKDKNTNIVKNLVIGIVLAFLIPLASIFLMISVIGLRLAFILLFLYFILLMSATSIACLVIAIKFADKLKDKNIIKYIIITTIVVAVLKQLPIISVWMEIILGFIGLGTIFKVIFTRKK